jgi:hypothetical protein
MALSDARVGRFLLNTIINIGSKFPWFVIAVLALQTIYL